MPYKITQERSTTSLNAIATHSTQGLNQLQGSQAIFRAPKPTHGSQAHPLENTNLESTTARKLKKWLASRKPSSSRVATYHSSKRSPPSPDPHVVTLILSMILNIPISTHQASHTKAYRKNSRYTQGVLAYTQKKKGGCTRYPGVHSAFADLPAQDLRLHPPNATPLSNPKLFPCPSLSRFPPLSRSWLFPVPSLARFLALLDPLPVGRGAAYGGRRGRRRMADGGRAVVEDVRLTSGGATKRARREDSGGWLSSMAIEGAAYGTTGASGAWDCK
jgi:hypothetical protein